MNRQTYDKYLAENRVPMQCHHCEHEWGTESKNENVVCPACHGSCRIRIGERKLRELIVDRIEEKDLKEE